MLFLPLLLRLGEREGLRGLTPKLAMIQVATLLNTEPAVSWLGQLLGIFAFVWLWRTAGRAFGPANAPPSVLSERS